MLLILAPLVLAAGQPASGPRLEASRFLRLGPAQYKAIEIPPLNRPATVNLQYQVLSELGQVRLVLIPQSEEERFQLGSPYQAVLSTPFQRAGSVVKHLERPGRYILIVDNRQQLHLATELQLRLAIDYDPPPPAARMLSRQRRWVVVGSSLGVFFAISLVAGRKLWRASAWGQTRNC
ncbi:MAG: hypothetical protein NZV14_05355 [Bryobacteraceae bacterium]|nr:hypothetical protein [Bryobacteraceae bacterium]MDW8377564.1 hypothetical protein [Bryobacterales bacterium]